MRPSKKRQKTGQRQIEPNLFNWTAGRYAEPPCRCPNQIDGAFNGFKPNPECLCRSFSNIWHEAFRNTSSEPNFDLIDDLGHLAAAKVG